MAKHKYYTDKTGKVWKQRPKLNRERNKLLAFLARIYPSHLKRHPSEDTEWDDEWRDIVCIHSPAGQMTWHIHDSEFEQFSFLNRKPDIFTDCIWDGHTTDEKYNLLAQLPTELTKYSIT